jgi:hypothetical protein
MYIASDFLCFFFFLFPLTLPSYALRDTSTKDIIGCRSWCIFITRISVHSSPDVSLISLSVPYIIVLDEICFVAGAEEA